MQTYNELMIEALTVEAVEHASGDGVKGHAEDVDDITIKFKVGDDLDEEKAMRFIEESIASFKKSSVLSTESKQNDLLIKFKRHSNNFTDMNYVVNGVYLPDTIKNDIDTEVELIGSKARLDSLDKETVYFVVDEYQSSSIVKYLTDNGYRATDNVHELEDLIVSVQ